MVCLRITAWFIPRSGTSGKFQGAGSRVADAGKQGFWLDNEDVPKVELEDGALAFLIVASAIFYIKSVS